MKKTVVSGVLALLAGGVFASNGSAICVRMTEAEQIAISDVIFDGVALPVDPPADPPTGSGAPRPAPRNDVHRFHVTRYLKGSGPAVVSVATMSNTSVGVHVWEGSAWRIFAQRAAWWASLPEGTLQTNVCLGSRPLPPGDRPPPGERPPPTLEEILEATHGPDPACAFDYTSCDPGRMAAVERVRTACDRSRKFRGIRFQGPHELGATWLRVGPRLGRMLIVTDCQPRWTGLDDPPRARGRSRRIYRLVGISPRVALSLGGSSRRILIARGVCAAARDGEGRLLRCLRQVSR